MTSFGLIPALWFAAMAAALVARRGGRDAGAPIREGLLIAAVAWGVWLVVGTELLSLGRWLSFTPVLLWWVVPALVLGWLAWKRRGDLAAALRGPRAGEPATMDGPPGPGRPDRLALGFLGATALILLATGIVAAVTPPNNWDSHAYHLPRQIHWLQQQSVAHYATFTLRQIVMPPMAEFAGLHLMILSGGDRWANLVQWFALGMTAVAASLIARELGARARGQSLAALLVVTNPMAAMQAVNTKNDLVLALWTCAMAYFALTVWTRCATDGATTGRMPMRRVVDARAHNHHAPVCTGGWWHRTIGGTFLLGASLGLMLLTKGTGFTYALPISAAAGVAILAVQRWRGLVTGAAIGIIALAINAGHFSRNFQDFGSPTGPPDSDGGFSVLNETFRPAAIASNLVRNITLHAATPAPAVNRGIESAVDRLHALIGIDSSDPRTTFLELPYGVVHRPLSESQAGAPVHLALAAAAPVLLLRRRRALLAVGLLVIAAGFVLFCIQLKWQPWHPRLHLPLVCLFAALAGVMLGRLRALAGIAALAATTVVAPAVLWNPHKPLIGSPSIFAASWEQNTLRRMPDRIEPLACVVRACDDLRPRTVAFAPTSDSWMYILQRALIRGLDEPPRFVGLGRHRTMRVEHPLEHPDVVIRIGATDGRLPLRGVVYIPAAHCGPYMVCIPEAVAAERGLEPPEPPPFFGWHPVEGLGRPEYSGGPAVRWGLGPATTLRFHSDGSPAVLVMECRRNPSTEQTLTVRLNGREVFRHEFGRLGAFRELRVPLEPEPGMNELALEYGVWDLPGQSRPLGVLFRRLQILAPED